jgi:hypothetical protein
VPVESSNFWTTISFYYFHSFRVPIRPVFQDLLRQRRRREVRLELQRRWRRQIQERRFLTSTQSLTRVNIWSGYQTWIWHELFKQIIESCHKNKLLYCNCKWNVGTLHMGNKLSNGHSPANLSNSSTRQKFAKFLWLAPANLASIEQIFVTRFGEFGEYWANLASLANLANLARVD